MILCNQGNFLLHGNGYKIKQCLKGAHIIFKGVIKNSHDDGRPKNGMFIAVPVQIKEHISDVSPKHWRVQAVTLRTPTRNILIINTYFPVDPHIHGFDTADLLSTLSAINDVIKGNELDSIVWIGDINADFSRQTRCTNMIESFIDQNEFSKSWDRFPTDFTHVYDINNVSHTSNIDHCIWSSDLREHITGVLHLTTNLSDQCPIYCQLKINGVKSKSVLSNAVDPKPSGKKASDEQKYNYTTSLQEKLRKLTRSGCIIDCRNVHCCEEGHSDNTMLTLHEITDHTANQCLPSNITERKKKKTPIASWSEEMQPFKDDSFFWHSVWVSAGKPLNTELHKIMKRSRNIYHFQIRKCKRMVNTLKRVKLLHACINGQGNLFDEIKTNSANLRLQ